MLYYALHNIKHYNETEQVRQGRRVRVWFIYCHFLLWRVLHSVDQGEAPRCQLRRPKTLERNSLAQISWPATAELTFNPVAEREPAKSFRKSSVSSDNDLQRLKDLMPTGFRQVMFREGVVWPEIVGFDERIRFQRAIITPKILYIDFGSKGHAWQSQPRSFHSRVRIPSRSAMCKQCWKGTGYIAVGSCLFDSAFNFLIFFSLFQDVSSQSCWILFAGVVLADDKLGSSLSHLAPHEIIRSKNKVKFHRWELLI